MPSPLTLLSSADPPPTGPAAVLLDDQPYPLEFFQDRPAIETAAHVERNGGDRTESFQARAAQARPELPPSVLFYPASESHVKTFIPVAERCPDHAFVVPRAGDRGERDALRRENKAFALRGAARDAAGYAVALLCNDWSREARVFIHQCRRYGVPVACLQESVNVDFDGQPRRMRWADYALVQGPQTLRYLDRRLVFLTGNPRYDGITPAPVPDAPRALINANFTYGVGEEWGREWIDAAVSAVKEAGVPYRISVHPQNTVDVSGLQHVHTSSAYRVGRQLAECTMVLSRDSALPYEALLHERHAIYFDPIGEPERCLREDDSGLIRKCASAGELAQQIRACADAPPPRIHGNEDLFRYVFTGVDGACADRVARALDYIAHYHREISASDALREWSVAAQWHYFVQSRVRPRMRRVTPARAAWRWGKRWASRHRAI